MIVPVYINIPSILEGIRRIRPRQFKKRVVPLLKNAKQHKPESPWGLYLVGSWFLYGAYRGYNASCYNDSFDYKTHSCSSTPDYKYTYGINQIETKRLLRGCINGISYISIIYTLPAIIQLFARTELLVSGVYDPHSSAFRYRYSFFYKEHALGNYYYF